LVSSPEEINSWNLFVGECPKPLAVVIVDGSMQGGSLRGVATQRLDSLNRTTVFDGTKATPVELAKSLYAWGQGLPAEIPPEHLIYAFNGPTPVEIDF
jgi:hypothetical protein